MPEAAVARLRAALEAESRSLAAGGLTATRPASPAGRHPGQAYDES